MDVSRDCQNFWGTGPHIISGTGKAKDFKFCRNIHRVDRTKARENVGNSAVGVVRNYRESENFQSTHI